MLLDTLLNQATHILAETASDPALPYSERLYQVAGAAVGFGLQLADCSPAELDELLPDTGWAEDNLEATVRAFATAPIQAELHAAAQSTGIPLLALAAGQILHHFLSADAATSQEQLHLLERATAYCLRFTLTLAIHYPDLARSYRELVPRSHTTSTRVRKQHPKRRL